MNIFLILILILVAIFFIASAFGNPGFWKATRKYPNEAWEFFSTNSEWHFEEEPKNIDVMGPYYIVNPNNGALVKIYCDSIKINESQKRFLQSIGKN